MIRGEIEHICETGSERGRSNCATEKTGKKCGQVKLTGDDGVLDDGIHKTEGGEDDDAERRGTRGPVISRGERRLRRLCHDDFGRMTSDGWSGPQPQRRCYSD